MITLNKSKTKAFAIRYFWSWYIYWIPTIMTEYHPKEDGVLNSLYIENIESYSAYGNCLTFTINLFVWTIPIDFWWNLTEK